MRRITAGLILGLGLCGWAATAEAQKRDRSVLTIQEIKERQDLTHAYDAVRLLRPQWLRPARPRGDLGGAATSSSPYRPKPEGRDGASGENNEAARGAEASREAARRSMAAGKVGPVLYVDDMKQAELEDMLRSIRLEEIVEFRYLTGTLALSRYGAGHEAGAILLTTTRLSR